MSLSIRRATPCLALVVAVLVAACSGGDPVSPRGVTHVPSLGKATTQSDTTQSDTTRQKKQPAPTTAPTNTKCPPVVGETTTDTTKSTGSRKCGDTAPWV
jgi:hypothetical protein